MDAAIDEFAKTYTYREILKHTIVNTKEKVTEIEREVDRCLYIALKNEAKKALDLHTPPCDVWQILIVCDGFSYTRDTDLNQLYLDLTKMFPNEIFEKPKNFED